MNKLTRGKITGSIILTAVLAFSMPLTVCAETYDIANGSISVNATTSGQTVTQGNNAPQDDNEPIITGRSNTNTVTINAESGATASVTIQGLSINLEYGYAAPITTSGAGDVVIELDGSCLFRGGDNHAALEKNNTGNLIIEDENRSGGLLETFGGKQGAGIGGGVGGDGSNITISKIDVEARGGSNGGAGIGGGAGGNGSDITISDGLDSVYAKGGNNGGAGIGGGRGGNGSNITITKYTVFADGGDNGGAGIGGGRGGSGSNITISEAHIVAQGGNDGGAGIGGGNGESGSNITISGTMVITIGGNDGGAGIGSGTNGTGANDIIIMKDARVFVSGGEGHNNGDGAAIGDGGTSLGTDGTPVSPNTTGLYTTGFVSIYPAGTSSRSIDTFVPGGTTTVGTLPDPNAPATTPTTTPVAGGRAIASSSSSSDNSVNDSEPSSIDFVLFLESIDKQIEDNLKKLNDLLASGDVAELNALRATGIKLDTGDWVSFRKSTYALIEQASKAGIPVTIDFIYQGQRYSTTIPAYAKVSPVSLCNEEGYCGFLNLIKNYGGVER